MLQGMISLVIKDVKITIRKPSHLVLSVIVPVVFVFLYSLITQTSFTNPVVIARESFGPASDRFVSIARETRSIDGPYFSIITTDYKDAYTRYNNGDVAGLIHIPRYFDRDLSSGGTPKVKILVNNINSDATKNFQLRLSHVIYLFHQEFFPGNQPRIVESFSKYPEDITMRLYVTIGLLMFGVIYSAMVNTGILIAREWEERTGKTISLSPKGFLPFIMGKWVTAFLQTLLSVLIFLLILNLVLDFPISRVSAILCMWMFTLFLFGASLGALTGVWLRKSLPLISLSAFIGICFFLLAGNESSIRGFAHAGAIKALWNISLFLPISHVTENMRQTFINTGSVSVMNGLPAMFATIVVFSVIAIWRLKIGFTYAQGQ